MKWKRLILVSVLATGCGRSYYRASADRETYPIISERVVKPEYSIGRTQLEPAATSRLADPTNPDRPPKPTDRFGEAPEWEWAERRRGGSARGRAFVRFDRGPVP